MLGGMMQSIGVGGTVETSELNLLTGNVGIGTTVPGAKLDVVGGIKTSRLGTYGTYSSTQVQGIWSVSEAFPIDTGSDDFGIQFGMGYAYNQNGGSPFASEHQIVFTNSGTVNAAIGLGGSGYFKGNVGIGTTVPGAALHILNGNATNIKIERSGSGDNVNIEYKNTDGSIFAGMDSSEGFTIGTSANLLANSLLTVQAGGNVGIGTGTPSAKLDVTSTTSGFLPPRMNTTQRDTIGTPATGLVIYNTTTNVLNFHNGVSWGAV